MGGKAVTGVSPFSVRLDVCASRGSAGAPGLMSHYRDKSLLDDDMLRNIVSIVP